MGFALYTGAPEFDEAAQRSSNPTNPTTATLRWISWIGEEDSAQTTSDVHVRQGRFLAHVGEVLNADIHKPLSNVVFDQTPLYLVIWVLPNETDPTSIRRLPPQTLQTVPHAVTAKQATNFTVTQTLTINGNLIANGEVWIDDRRFNNRLAWTDSSERISVDGGENNASVLYADRSGNADQVNGLRLKRIPGNNGTVNCSTYCHRSNLHCLRALYGVEVEDQTRIMGGGDCSIVLGLGNPSDCLCF
jgi:hypothetical protein